MKPDIVDALKRLGVVAKTELEVHCSLSRFGTVCGGAETVIAALKETCSQGSIFIPSLRLSPELPLSHADRELGIQTKIQILSENCDRSAMGVVADIFRKQPEVVTGDVENLLAQKISDIFATNEKAKKLYPPEQWFIETGCTPVKAWYTIQRMAFDKGLIQKDMIGSCKVMYFKIWDVVGLYEDELRKNPYKLYGIEK